MTGGVSDTSLRQAQDKRQAQYKDGWGVDQLAIQMAVEWKMGEQTCAVDACDRPDLAGGIALAYEALKTGLDQLDWERSPPDLLCR